METLKKIRRFLTGMPLAIALLVLLAAACALCSAVNQDGGWERSWWFIGLSAFLCLNLLGCSAVRLKPLIRRYRTARDPIAESGSETARAEGVADAEALIRAMGIREIRRGQDPEGREMLGGARNAAGIWGAWVCHLGILLLIAGFALGQMTKEETFIYGVPGQTREVAGTGLTVTIDDFQVGLRADDTVEQYTSRITVSDRETGKQEQAEVTVNGPAVLFGRKFYQNSTGFAADAHVLKDGAEWQTETLCAGEGMSIRGKEDLQVILRAFYPDYVREKDGRPATASGEIRNPGYLYMAVYRGEVLGMNVLLPGDELTIDEYTVTFENPRNYTLISVKRDRFTLTALIGGIIVLAGLGMALYLRPEKIRAVREADGTWTVSGWCRKGGALWKERFDEAVRKQKGEEAGHG